MSNPHITKNKIVEASKEHVDEVAALDKEKNSEAKAEGETAKVSIRNVRRNILEKVKKLKDAGVPEDEIKSVEKEMQDVTDKFIKNTDSVIAAKEKEIMSI